MILSSVFSELVGLSLHQNWGKLELQMQSKVKEKCSFMLWSSTSIQFHAGETLLHPVKWAGGTGLLHSSLLLSLCSASLDYLRLGLYICLSSSTLLRLHEIQLNSEVRWHFSQKEKQIRRYLDQFRSKIFSIWIFHSLNQYFSSETAYKCLRFPFHSGSEDLDFVCPWTRFYSQISHQ